MKRAPREVPARHLREGGDPAEEKVDSRFRGNDEREKPCTPIVPTVAPSCGSAMSARPFACPDGSTASVTTATCFSSIYATTTASRRLSPTRDRRHFRFLTG